MATPSLDRITLRGLGDDLAKRITELARREGISLNRAARRLLRLGAGLVQGAADTVGGSLDDHIGTWTDEEADAFDAVVRDFETIDPPHWR